MASILTLRDIPTLLSSGHLLWTDGKCFTETFQSSARLRMFCVVVGWAALFTIDIWQIYLQSLFGFIVAYKAMHRVPHRVLDMNVKSWLHAVIFLLVPRLCGLNSFFHTGLCAGWVALDIQRDDWTDVWIIPSSGETETDSANAVM